MAKQKFNLTSLLNNKSMEIDKEQVEEIKEDFDIKMIDIDDLEPSKENFYNTDEIEEMKQSIELLGIEQNLVVEELQSGKHKIIAGHRRTLASKMLVQEGKEQYRDMPCRIKNKKNDILNKLTMIMTNSTQRQITDYEKMMQVIEIEKLVIELKREANIPGRTRDLLSDITNTSSSQLARYKAINKNLNEELVKALKDNKISFSTAYEASQLSESMQNKVNDLLNSQDVSLQDVKELKRQEEEYKQIPGQINVLENENTLEKNKEQIYQEEEKEEEIIKENITEEDEAEEIDEIDHIENQEQITVEENNTKESIIIEKTKIEQKKGCNFCRGETSIATKGGKFSMYIEDITHRVYVVDNNTGEVDEVVCVLCPICGTRL